MIYESMSVFPWHMAIQLRFVSVDFRAMRYVIQNSGLESFAVYVGHNRCSHLTLFSVEHAHYHGLVDHPHIAVKLRPSRFVEPCSLVGMHISRLPANERFIRFDFATRTT